MAHIIIDTHVFRRLKTELENLLQCIRNVDDTIIITTELEKEYKSRKDPSYINYKSYLDDIKNECDIDREKPSRVKKRFDYKNNSHKYKLPSHHKDQKFFKTAVSENAKYMITNDPDLLLPPFNTNGNTCQCVTPQQYISQNCS